MSPAPPPIWYIPSQITAWKNNDRDCSNPAIELLALNHPEAFVESHEEMFDRSLFEDLFDNETEITNSPSNVMADVMAAISAPTSDFETELGGDNSGLIDKFLSVKDLRIVAEEETRKSENEIWSELEQNDSFNAEDNDANEELAAIYLSQGLFEEAKEIYSRLFLLYSEKSVYFARQIETIEKKQLNN